MGEDRYYGPSGGLNVVLEVLVVLLLTGPDVTDCENHFGTAEFGDMDGEIQAERWSQSSRPDRSFVRYHFIDLHLRVAFPEYCDHMTLDAGRVWLDLPPIALSGWFLFVE